MNLLTNLCNLIFLLFLLTVTPISAQGADTLLFDQDLKLDQMAVADGLSLGQTMQGPQDRPVSATQITQAWWQSGWLFGIIFGLILGILGMNCWIRARRFRNERAMMVKLLESEERFSKAFRLSSVAQIISHSQTGEIIEANQAWSRLVGYSSEEAIGCTVMELGIIDQEKSQLFIDEALANGTSYNFETTIRTRTNQQLNILGSIEQFEINGEPAVLSTVIDITERKQAENALRESEERLSLLMEHTPFGIQVFDIDATLVQVNKTWETMWGVRAEEVVGSYNALADPQIDALGLRSFVERAFAGEAVQFHDTCYAPGQFGFPGRERWVRAYCYHVPDESGQIKHVVLLTEDITERKQAEAAARQADQQRQNLIDTVEGIVWEADAATFEFSFVSARAERLLGYPVQCWLEDANFWADHIHPDDRDATVDYCIACTRDKQDHEFEYRMVAADGRIVWLRDLVTVVEDERPVTLRGVMVDITSRKETEDALQKSRAQLQLAVEAANVGLWDWDLKADTVYYSRQWKSQIGYAEDEITNDFNEWQSRLHPDDIAHALNTVQAYLHDPRPRYEVEFRLRHKDGTYRWIMAQGSLLFDEADQPHRMLGSHIDVTEFKQAEETLRQSERRLNEAQHLAKVGSYSWEPDNPTIWSNYMFTLFGVPLGETLTFERFLSAVKPEDRQRVETEWHAFLDSWQTYWELDYQITSEDGAERTVVAVGQVERNSEGQAIKVTGTVQDITERKKAEAERDAIFVRNEALVHALGEIVYEWWPLQDEVLWDGDYERILGYSATEMGDNTASWASRIHPDDMEHALQEVNEASQERRMYNLEYRFQQRDGNYRWMHDQGILFHNSEGELERIIGILRDISERKQAEMIRQNYVQFLETMKTIDQIVLGSDRPEQMLNGVLAEMLDVFGSDRAWLYYPCDPQMPAWSIPMEKTRPEYPGVGSMEMEIPMTAGVRRMLREHLDSTEVRVFASEALHNVFGEDAVARFQIQSQMSMIILSKIDKPWVLGLHQCTHERQWTEQEQHLFREIGGRVTDSLNSLLLLKNLQQSEARYRAIVEDQTELICRLAPEGTFNFVNRAYAHYYGKQPEALIGSSLNPSPILAEDRPMMKAHYSSLTIENPIGQIKHRVMLPGGEIRWQRWTDRALFDEEGQLVEYQSVGRDVTEQVRAEEAMQRYNDRLTILHQIDLGIVVARSLEEIAQPVLDGIRRVIPCKRSSIALFDMDAAEIEIFATNGGINSEIGLGQRLPFVRSQSIEQLERGQSVIIPDLELHQNSVSPGTIELLVKEGLRSTMSVPLFEQDQLIGVFSLLADTPHYFTAEHEEIATEVANQLAIAIHQNRLYQQIQQYTDELEDRVAQRTAQLEAANKELEAFAYSVSHDLRAPLRVIDGFSQILQEEYKGKLDADGARYLQNVRINTLQMGQLIDDLLRLSRVTQAEMHIEMVNLSYIVDKIAKDLQKDQPDRQVEIIIAPNLSAEGDRTLLKVVIQNLLENAWKYTSHHPTARIEFGAEEIEGQQTFFLRDDGAGFDMTYIDKLFGAFQRLHRASDFTGSGIGLATVRRIIHRHGGHIWAVAAVEEGATFYFTL